ncbi:PH domain-containing protein [Sporosarcina sp. Marseille-Q4063]|uniref:PH domain-containing protein n=1 Tax=Sporosarcina sp. Marseille-Q4063 TaxID=2810514 RepID=UPI001BAEFE58|nr:PH domain-containing protein [Sporosarcina sp. Marseille-Q4063]QUW22836.1 PH domain-containing protein [Sporosarcina sp. Marseille-Q4063]
MNDIKRYHPFLIVMNLWVLLKNSFAIFVFFIFSFALSSPLYSYGRIAFLLFLALAVIKIILDWFVDKYEIVNESFQIYHGLFIKNERIVPFTKVQNVQRQTSFIHRLFKLTSLTLETGIAGSDAAVEFVVITIEEADHIEDLINQVEYEIETTTEIMDDYSEVETKSDRIIHFTPTKKDIFKASFTSFSFLLLIPIVGSIFSKVQKFEWFEKKAEGIFSRILESSFTTVIIVILLIIVSIIIGIARTYIKYGKYEIASDDERIYITKGVLHESAFTITKDNVQAIEIRQSAIKRVLGLAEIKVISAGGVGEGMLEPNSLYPFLPIARAYEMIHEILPSYEVMQTMKRLPRKSFWIRMLKPSWFWIISMLALFYFKPPIWDFKQAWWIISIILLLVIIASRLLNYFNTRYTLNEEFIQFKTGSFETSVFISKRTKIIEISVRRSKIQQILGLASVVTVNHAKPFHYSGVDDVPLEMARNFYTWYAGRVDQIKTE